VLQRVREVSEDGLILAGEPTEGQILGGVKAGPQPPGRDTLVRRRRQPELVQLSWVPEEPAGPNV
jgi:S-DNA-T family DNA segregation ATPase FtsK/SpoIIIE